MTKSTKRKLEYQKEFNARPEEVAKHVKNNAARREAIREGKVRVDNGGSNHKSNLEVQDRSKNRGWRRGSGSYNPDK